MVEDLEECPECHADWRGPEISRDSLEKGYYGHRPPCQKKREWDTDWDASVPCECPVRYYSQLIGIEYPERYDGVSEWMCPWCNTRWDRWTKEIITT